NPVSDVRGKAEHVDTALVNAWGVAVSDRGLIEVANAGTSTVSLYMPNDFASPVHLRIPAPPTSSEHASPTGLVFNTTDAFVMAHGGTLAPATILVATENGSIAGWTPTFGTLEAFTVVDSTHWNASYKGLTRARTPAGDRLLATDFHNGHVDVFDES